MFKFTTLFFQPNQQHMNINTHSFTPLRRSPTLRPLICLSKVNTFWYHSRLPIEAGPHPSIEHSRKIILSQRLRLFLNLEPSGNHRVNVPQQLQMVQMLRIVFKEMPIYGLDSKLFSKPDLSVLSCPAKQPPGGIVIKLYIKWSRSNAGLDRHQPYLEDHPS